MKKRSKLFLLISGIVFLVGVIVCLVGVSVSASEGMQLYASKLGDGRGYTYDFGDGNTDKIKISVTDADINIYGGSERSYIEVVNFNENLCSYSGNDAIINFREASEVEDITGVWENGLSFKGLRYLIRFSSKDKPKTVNIYLENAEDVKAIELKLQKGDVKISDVKTVSDYKITMESGNVALSEIITDSSVKIKASGEMSTDIVFTRVRADIVEIDAHRSKFKAEGFSTDDCRINVETGSADFGFMPINGQYTVNISTKGKLVVNGETCHNSYKYPAADDPANGPSDGGEETAEVSSLEIRGSDFSVIVDTPQKESDNKDEKIS